MKFQPALFGAAAVAVTITATTLSSAPAQAAAITAGSTLNLNSVGLTGGGVKITGNTLDFFSETDPLSGDTSGQRTSVAASTGSFFSSSLASLIPPLPQIQDLTLVATATPNIFTSGPRANFITGIDIFTGVIPFPPFVTAASVAFDLESFTYNALTGDATFAGLFRSGSDSIQGIGRFTSQLEFAEPSSYSISITAVPTPALLPGLVGFGIAALRKRRAIAAESEN